MSVDIYGISPPMYVPLIENNYKSKFGMKYGLRKNKINELYLMNMCIENTVKAKKPSPKSIINAKDLKSCLRCLTDKNLYKNTLNTQKTQNGRRKKVSFADAHGKKLTLVKYLTVPSNEPPELDFLNDVLMNLQLSCNTGLNENVKSSNCFKLKPKFEQPVSDYMNFKMRLESNMVCVENALVNNNEIKGTIKVKNIDFHKKVNVVITFDNWKTKSEVPASYINSPYGSSLYDTFQFKVTVPSSYEGHQNLIHFCVRYNVNENEYWDNNDTLNYTIVPEGIQIMPSSRKITSLYNVPSLYNELPQPEYNTWEDWENERFY